MRKILLRCNYSPGDIVLLTACVRDLHLCHPGRFVTDVQTGCDELWENNPHITKLDPNSPDVEKIDVTYPLIQESNTLPYHVIHGFMHYLSAVLKVSIRPTSFKGDIHLSEAEKLWTSQVGEIANGEVPFWIIVSGGKTDATVKWWDSGRYQEVVDYFQGRILFVQVGARGHHHPGLRGALDLRGKTTLRQLVRLIYHAQGVLSPITAVMHLAAAVETKPGTPKNRACVVIAGGREPAHWEAYPHHQFIHTGGALLCCDNGGCWKSRVYPLNDGDERDKPENLCVDVVNRIPRCMDMISVEEVINRVELYFKGGSINYLTQSERVAAHQALELGTNCEWNTEAISINVFRNASENYIKGITPSDTGFRGRGIVICAGGEAYFTNAWVCINMLRMLGCKLPVELWHLGPEEITPRMAELVAPLNVVCIDALKMHSKYPARILSGWPLKCYALLHSTFNEVLLLDADNVPVVNPEFLFVTQQFKETGSIFWPDIRPGIPRQVWDLFGADYHDEPEFESGQIIVNKRKAWKALSLAMWYNEHADFYYRYVLGDKDTFHMAFRKLRCPFSFISTPVYMLSGTMCQHDFTGRRIFQHRNMFKWDLHGGNISIDGFLFENECLAFISELRQGLGVSKAPELPMLLKRKPMELGQARTYLTETVFEYRRGESELRRMTFGSDGRITFGRSAWEENWRLISDGTGHLYLELYAPKAIYCRLFIDSEGTWIGRTADRNPKIIRLIPETALFIGNSPARSQGITRKELLFRAPLNGYTGYGLHSTQIVTDLERMGFRFNIRATDINETFAEVPHHVRKAIICQEMPSEWELILHPPGFHPVAGKRTIYFTMWEATRLMKHAVDPMNLAECIIVPTQWNASCFVGSGIQKPIYIVPLGINAKTFRYSPMNMKGPCTFGAAGRLESGGIRKGLNRVIQLFQKAFPNEKDVRLNVKVFPDCAVQHVPDHRIRIDRQFFDETQLASWFGNLTCFVSCSRGEGWGLMQHQALAVGRPIISVRFGGVAEFFLPEMGYPVDHNLIDAWGLYANCGVWAEPDDEHVIEHMRQVYKDREQAQKKGLKGRQVGELTWESSNQKLVEVLKTVGMVD